ncbi:signal peptide peptidase SppA [Curtanaerobium respiraculi]|uniref:signal peptide peptidase SppA n=1 Tax=Curtanaerobium respiraculi TaxID=2949669 RepID=UPI0024B388F6|nr:signal peptide peptidase SppA [Curtanaerobium respiraculi]
MAENTPYDAPQPPYNAWQQAQPPYPQPAQPARPKKKRGWIVALVIVAIIALLAFSVSSCTQALMSGGGDMRVAKPGTVAVINLDGTIKYDGSSCSPEGLKSLLDEAEGDENIVAVVLRVNSGGGTATAGEEMAQYVRDFSKPIVVSCASINASAAYEISSQADYIFAAKSTETGCIGTAMQTIDYSGLLELLGVQMTNITSSPNKDSSYGTRPLTDEERAYYQDMVNQINQVFIDNVVQGRRMSVEQVTALATGLPFTGVQAVQNGLIDEIGTLEDAEAKAAELAGASTDDVPVTTLKIESHGLSDLLDLLSSSSNSGGISVDQLAKALKELNHGDGIVQ